MPTLATSTSLSSMAKLLLLLLAVWVLAGELWLRAEARAAPYGVKLCGREFIRAVIFTCGGSRWRRSDILAQDAMGKAWEVVCVCWGWWMGPEQVQGARDGDEIGAGRGESQPYHMQLGGSA